jgi:hypothetical protein
MSRTVMRSAKPAASNESKAPQSNLLSRRDNGQGRAASAPPIVHEVLNSPGQPLDDATRAYMEPRFGHDFSKVRVHADGKAAESARAVNAVAYTVGRDVAFDLGQYQPRTVAGKKLLAHELTHVIQQADGIHANLEINQAEDQYEEEADRTAAAIVRIEPAVIVDQAGARSKRQLMKQKGEEPKTERKNVGSNVKEINDKPQQASTVKTDTGGKDLKNKPSQEEERNPDRTGYHDDAVHWWLPLGERIAQWGYDADVVYVNIDKTTLREDVGPWVRNALDAAIFAVGVGVATEVALKRLKLTGELLQGLGLGVGFGVAYKGLDLRERLRSRTVEVYEWYGRYRYHYGSGKLLAVEYWGKGPTKRSTVSPVYYEQAIVDADNKVLYVNTDKLEYFGISLDNKAFTLPLTSYGKVDEVD